MIKVAHIITGLAADGAERMLFNLTTQMDRQRFANSVVSLTSMGDLGNPLQREGIPVQALGLGRNINSLGALWHLRRMLHVEKPDIVQTWMYHADLVGGLAAQAAGIRRVFWGVHHCDVSRGSMKWPTRVTVQVCAEVSRYIPRKIVFCSEASRVAHTRIGYTAAKMTFIPNGFDTSRFRPDEATRQLVRSELGVSPNALVVGMLGRHHPHKDHANFISAAATLAQSHPEIQFVLCGRDVTSQNEELWSRIKAAGLAGRTLALGAREDIPRILTALDILVSSSQTEAFPLAVGEAMATGVPCVVTDVGDSRLLVGDTGVVVQPGDPSGLANGIASLVEAGDAGRRSFGSSARARIQDFFSLTSIVRRYEDLYSQSSTT